MPIIERAAYCPDYAPPVDVPAFKQAMGSLAGAVSVLATRRLSAGQFCHGNAVQELAGTIDLSDISALTATLAPRIWT